MFVTKLDCVLLKFKDATLDSFVSLLMCVPKFWTIGYRRCGCKMYVVHPHPPEAQLNKHV